MKKETAKARLEKQTTKLEKMMATLDRVRFGMHDITLDGYLIDAKEDLEAAIERFQKAAERLAK